LDVAKNHVRLADGLLGADASSDKASVPNLRSEPPGGWRRANTVFGAHNVSALGFMG
jgi:hypothetical protein